MINYSGKTFYECKARYTKQLEDGMLKNVSELYLVEAVNFGDAETRFIEFLTPYSNEFTVSAIKINTASDIIVVNPEEEHDKFFKFKVYYITYDERTGKEKKTGVDMLVKSSDFYTAKDDLIEYMKDTMVDYVISAEQESPILDIIPIIS